MTNEPNQIPPNGLDRPIFDPFLGAAMLRGDFVTSAMTDMAWTLLVSRIARGRRGKILRSTPMESLITSTMIGLSVILIRELVVSPLILTSGYGNTPQLQERQHLYGVERKAKTLGDRDARGLTKELHKRNDQYWLNRVGETGIAGILTSFMAPVITTYRRGGFLRSTPLRLGYGAAMTLGQVIYNDVSKRADEPKAHFYRSNSTRTARELEAAISTKTVEELHRDLKLESLWDNSIQVQKELSVVRRALALNASQR